MTSLPTNGPYRDPGWYCDAAAVCPPIRPIVLAAIADLERPTYEDPLGSQRGPLVERYGAFIDGEWRSWCAAACSAWVSAAEPNPLPRPLMSAFKWIEWAKSADRLIEANASLLPGDVAVLLRPDVSGHVELVVRVLDSTRIACIGGNVHHRVWGTVRMRDEFSCFIRPVR